MSSPGQEWLTTAVTSSLLPLQRQGLTNLPTVCSLPPLPVRRTTRYARERMDGGRGERIMHIELGRPVMSRDGKRIGTVDQLVLDPATREVQAIIVHRGWLLSEDRIVDRALIDAVAPDGTVWLSVEAEQTKELRFSLKRSSSV